MYVGTITADEIVYAGGKVDTSNQNYYLINNYQKTNGAHIFWSLSPHNSGGIMEEAFSVNNDGRLNPSYVNDNYAFRPAVSLASSAVISEGVGTLESPYVIG